jgi:hypothetical protein
MVVELRAHLIARDNAAPECYICPALLMRRTTFGRKVLHRGRRWDRVERHVHDGGYAPGRSRTSARPKALPVRPPRLVKVHMRTGEDTRGQGWELRHMWGGEGRGCKERVEEHVLDESWK